MGPHVAILGHLGAILGHLGAKPNIFAGCWSLQGAKPRILRASEASETENHVFLRGWEPPRALREYGPGVVKGLFQGFPLARSTTWLGTPEGAEGMRSGGGKKVCSRGSPLARSTTIHQTAAIQQTANSQTAAYSKQQTASATGYSKLTWCSILKTIASQDGGLARGRADI